MFSRFSKVFLVLSSALLLSVPFALLSGVYSANAASIHDETVRTATKLIVTHKEVPANKDVSKDITGSWFNTLVQYCPAVASGFQTAENQGDTNISIIEDRVGSDFSGDRVLIRYNDNRLNTTEFFDSDKSLRLTGETTGSAIIYITAEGNLEAVCSGAGYYISSKAYHPSPTYTQSFRVFFSTYRVTYPDGFNGTDVPANRKEDYYPQFEYSYSGTGVAITQFKKIPGGLNRYDVKLFKADENYNAIGDSVDTDLARLLYAGSNSYVEAPYLGKYVLDVYIYPPPGSSLLDEYNFKPTFIHLNLDGSTASGNSYGENCVNGSCSIPPIYEECDLIDIPCHFRNFWTGLKTLFVFILIPSSSDMSRLFDDANSFIHTKFGFLTYPFDWIYSLFGAMANSSAACNGVSLSGIPSVSPGDRFFGSPVNLNVCSAEHDFPKIYNIAVFFIRVVLVLAMVAAVYRKFLVTLGDHGSRYQDGRTEELYR